MQGRNRSSKKSCWLLRDRLRKLAHSPQIGDEAMKATTTFRRGPRELVSPLAQKAAVLANSEACALLLQWSERSLLRPRPKCRLLSGPAENLNVRPVF